MGESDNTLYIRNFQYSLKVIKHAKKQENTAHTWGKKKLIEIAPEEAQIYNLLENTSNQLF